MRPRTDRQTRVTTIRFASSTTHVKRNKSRTYARPASFLRFFRFRVHVHLALGRNPRLVRRRVVVRLHGVRVLDLTSPPHTTDSTGEHLWQGWRWRGLWPAYAPTTRAVFRHQYCFRDHFPAESPQQRNSSSSTGSRRETLGINSQLFNGPDVLRATQPTVSKH